MRPRLALKEADEVDEGKPWRLLTKEETLNKRWLRRWRQPVRFSKSFLQKLFATYFGGKMVTSKSKHAHYLCKLKPKKKSKVYQRITVTNCGPDHACVKDERPVNQTRKFYFR